MCRVCYGQSLSCAESNSQAAVTSGLSDLKNHDGYREDATVGAFGAEFGMCPGIDMPSWGRNKTRDQRPASGNKIPDQILSAEYGY